MTRFVLLAGLLALLPAARPLESGFRPPPNCPPGWDDIPDSDLVVSPVDPMNSTSLKLVCSTGYNYDNDETPTLLDSLTVKAQVRGDVPAGSFGERQDWFDNEAVPVTFQVQGAPVVHELMTLIVTGLQPDTTYCFGIQGVDFEGYHSLLDDQNLALGSTTADAVRPDPIRPSDVVVTGTTETSAMLSVITPGDDAPYLGHATTVEFRFSRTAPGLDLAAWYAAIPYSNHRSFDAGPAHASQALTIAGLEPGTLYHACGRALDETLLAGDLVGSFSFQTAAGQPSVPGSVASRGLCAARGDATLPAALAALVVLGLLIRR